MRATTFAFAFATLLALPATGFADEIADCNSDQPDKVIAGCTLLIDAGKANGDALAVAYFNRGNAFDDGGDHDRAIADYTQSIKLKPDYADSRYNRGLSYMGKQDHDSALADFAEVIKLQPDSGRAYYAQGRAYEGKGDFKQALASFEDAAKRAPDNKLVQKKIAEMKQKLAQ